MRRREREGGGKRERGEPEEASLEGGALVLELGRLHRVDGRLDHPDDLRQRNFVQRRRNSLVAQRATLD
eukprot:6203484-Pleurochrysis_carterae.AAC.1